MSSAGVGYPVELPVFSGPLDLLLHLVEKNEVSIHDIPIVLICDQFQEHLRTMRELDLDVAGEFLWMASWLLQLKSRALLPRRDVDEPDPREELVERLVAYRQVKALAEILHETDVVRRCLWGPAVSGVPTEEPELDLEDLDLRTLAWIYLDTMQRFAVAHPPPLAVAPLRHSVEQKMVELSTRVRDQGLVPLLRHIDSVRDAEEVVVLVVATLELVRLRAVAAEQRRPFAEIYLRPGERPYEPRRRAEAPP